MAGPCTSESDQQNRLSLRVLAAFSRRAALASNSRFAEVLGLTCVRRRRGFGSRSQHGKSPLQADGRRTGSARDPQRSDGGSGGGDGGSGDRVTHQSPSAAPVTVTGSAAVLRHLRARRDVAALLQRRSAVRCGVGHATCRESLC